MKLNLKRSRSVWNKQRNLRIVGLIGIRINFMNRHPRVRFRLKILKGLWSRSLKVRKSRSRIRWSSNARNQRKK